jgi:K+:H+ antiporter
VFFLIRWANDNFESDFPVITTILVIMGLMALTTHFIGVHTVLGAFVAGVLIGESPILSKHIDEQLRGMILAFFMPVFFGVAGLSADLTVLKDPQLALMALGLIAIASVGKFGGAFIGGKIGGLTRRESLALGCGMNARGSTEVIVATIGLSMGALSQNLFTMIVAMAVVTTMAMPPMLRWALRRVPMRKAEKERLEREEQEAKGFVPNLERLLLAADDSPNGKFAARLAGLLAGPRGMPITVLPLEPEKTPKRADESKPKPDADTKEITSAEVAKAAAESTRSQEQDETPLSPVDVTVRARAESTEEAVAREAEKGHDLLVLGTKQIRGRSGGFHPDVAGLAAAFDGPLAVVAGDEALLKQPEQCPARILVPVAGTDVSRRAAEVAIAIGRSCNALVRVLYVSGARTNGRGRGRGVRLRAQEQAILKDIVEIADRYDVAVTTAVRADVAPDDAILSEAKKGGYDLIIMGVNRRPGEKLFFGDTAASVFEHAPGSVVLVAT